MIREGLQTFPGQMAGISPEKGLRLWLALGCSLVVHGLLLGLGGRSVPPAIAELVVPVEVSFRISRDAAELTAPAPEFVPVAQEKTIPHPVARNTNSLPQKNRPRVLAVDTEPDAVFSQVKSESVLNTTETEVGEGTEGNRDASAGEVISREKRGGALRENVLREYRAALVYAARKVRRYPPLAREQGWEGVAQVRVSQESGDGQLMIRLEGSSRYGLLDEQALLMLQKAVAQAPVPESLVGQSFTLMLPVEFNLDQP